MKRKFLIAIGMIVLFLVVLIPFASSSPDGLGKVAESLGIEEIAPAWRSLMCNYSVGVITNPYASTLVAGIIGTFLVLGFSLILGKAVTKKGNVA
jgi:hypothetical protein